jgi:hypothetical protein
MIMERPPNFDRILAAFPDADKPGVIFAWAPHVYNPSGAKIPRALLAHEEVHQVRQSNVGGPEKWWEKYIEDAEFRYVEELHAHVAEYRIQAILLVDRNLRARLLQSTAQRLIASLYNYQPPRSLGGAMRDLKRELNL